MDRLSLAPGFTCDRGRNSYFQRWMQFSKAAATDINRGGAETRRSCSCGRSANPLSSLFLQRRFNPNRSHHAAVDVLHDVTMERKRAEDSRITKIHPQLYAGIDVRDPIPRRQI